MWETVFSERFVGCRSETVVGLGDRKTVFCLWGEDKRGSIVLCSESEQPSPWEVQFWSLGGKTSKYE